MPKAVEGQESIERSVQLKMSKSITDAPVFMDDSQAEITRKIQQAYCPPNTAHENPVLEYCKYIVFERQKLFVIERPQKFGGPAEFASYSALQAAYEKGEIHPMDLKTAVAKAIDTLIEPVRKHFEKGKAKKLLEQVTSFKITR